MNNQGKLWAAKIAKTRAEIREQTHGFLVPAFVTIDSAPGEPAAWIPLGAAASPAPSLTTAPATTWMPLFTTREAAEAFAQAPADVVEFNMEVMQGP